MPAFNAEIVREAVKKSKQRGNIVVLAAQQQRQGKM